MEFDDRLHAICEPSPRDTVDDACVDCLTVFPSPKAWYRARGLEPPKRCPRCRAARRRARIEGLVVFVDARRRFGFIAANDGTFYFAECDVSGWPIAPGDRVTFMPEEPAPDKPRPRARLIQIIERAQAPVPDAVDDEDRA